MNGIIQWLRLRLDPRAKERMLRDAREAGRETGDALGQGGRRAGDAVKRSMREAFDDAERQGRRAARNTESAWRRAFGGIRGLFSGLGGILVGWGLGRFVRDMWELGTAAEETQAKFNTVFGREASADMQEFLDGWASMAGVNRTNAQEFSATAAAIVQGMGASRSASSEFSEQILRLSGDLLSFHNARGGLQETFQAVRSGLTGEYESLKKYGIVLRQTDIDTIALSQSNKSHKDELTQLERAQAALTLMQRLQGEALGDLEKTQNSTANRARNLRAEYENLKIELARGLLPVFASLIDSVEENKDELGELARGAGTVARVVGGVLWAAFNSLASLLAGSVSQALGGIIWTYRQLERAVLKVVLAKEKFKRVFKAGSEEAVEAARRDLEENKQAIQEAGAMWREGWREFGRAFTEIPSNFNQVWGLGRGAEGEFEWREQRTLPELPTREDPREAARAERDRQQELAAQVRLLEEMSERRERFPELVQRAADLEKRLTAELDAQGTSTQRRVELMRQIDALQAIIQGRDATSLRREQDRRQNLEQSVADVERLFELEGHTAGVLAQAGMIEAAITLELEKQGVEIERQIELQDQLNRIRTARAESDPSVFRVGDESNPLFREDIEDLMEHYQGFADFVSDVAEGFADAWEAAFDRVVMEGGDAADALVAFGKTMGGAVLDALASFARGKMQENVAAAIEQLAYAAAAFAWGNAPKGSAHLKSAASHGAAVAAWGVLAGLAGAGARAVSGGGGGAGGAGDRRGGDRVDQSRTLPMEVHLYVDGIDPRNPEHQRLTHATVAAASHRLGLPVEVTYHDVRR